MPASDSILGKAGRFYHVFLEETLECVVTAENANCPWLDDAIDIAYFDGKRNRTGTISRSNFAPNPPNHEPMES